LARILVAACPSKRASAVKDKEGKTRPISYASAMEPLDALAAWIVSQLKNATGLAVGLCIPAMTALMEATETRRLFSQSGGLKYLSRQLRVGSKGAKKEIGQSSVQQLYEMTFCMWTLSYELNPCYPVRCDFAKDGTAIAALVDLVSAAPREKVVRVALSALTNCATCTADESPPPAGSNAFTGKHFLGEMIACGLMKSIDNLRDRQFTDPDIIMGEFFCVK
jgi:V-type H+-transporting ATPase subunit H